MIRTIKTYSNGRPFIMRLPGREQLRAGFVGSRNPHVSKHQTNHTSNACLPHDIQRVHASSLAIVGFTVEPSLRAHFPFRNAAESVHKVPDSHPNGRAQSPAYDAEKPTEQCSLKNPLYQALLRYDGPT